MATVRTLDLKVDIDAKNTIRAVDEVTREIERDVERMTASLNDLTNTVTTGFDDMEERFTQLAGVVKATVSEIGDQLGNLGRAVQFVKNAFDSVGEALDRFHLASTAATVAYGALVYRIANSTATLSRQAQAIGTNIDNLRSLQFAFQRFAVPASSVFTVLTQISVAIQAAADGNERYIRAFDKINLNFEQLQRLDVVDAFDRVRNSISRVASTQERFAVTNELFGAQIARTAGKLVSASVPAYDKVRQALGEIGSTYTTNLAGVEVFSDVLAASFDTIKVRFSDAILSTFALDRSFQSFTRAIRFAGQVAYAFGRTIAGVVSFLIEHKALVLGLVAAYTALRVVVFSFGIAFATLKVLLATSLIVVATKSIYGLTAALQAGQLAAVGMAGGIGRLAAVIGVGKAVAIAGLAGGVTLAVAIAGIVGLLSLFSKGMRDAEAATRPATTGINSISASAASAATNLSQAAGSFDEFVSAQRIETINALNEALVELNQNTSSLNIPGAPPGAGAGVVPLTESPFAPPERRPTRPDLGVPDLSFRPIRS